MADIITHRDTLVELFLKLLENFKLILEQISDFTKGRIQSTTFSDTSLIDFDTSFIGLKEVSFSKN